MAPTMAPRRSRGLPALYIGPLSALRAWAGGLHALLEEVVDLPCPHLACEHEDDPSRTDLLGEILDPVCQVVAGLNRFVAVGDDG